MNVKLFIKSGLIAGLITASGISHADFIGIYVDANAWQFKGPVQVSEEGNTFSNRVFDIDKTSKMSASVRFEHPVPILPNVRLRYTPINFYTEKSQAVSGTSGLVSTDASLSADIQTYDATLYYELLDNVVSVDLGINGKQFKGTVTEQDVLSTSLIPITVTRPPREASWSITIPMAYLAAQVSIPTTKLSVGAEVSGISYDGSKVSDASAEIKYKFIDNLAFDLGAKLGYRQIKLLLDDVDNINADATLKGAYAGLEAHF